MNMRVLVTGAGGQLGTALKEMVGEATGAAAARDEWMFTGLAELDITDRGAVEYFFERERPAAVVNCAAFTDVDRAQTERETAFLVNRDAPRFLAEAAAACGAALVHISTDFVFDGTADRPYTEQDAPAPLNVYGESKLSGERAVMASGCRGAIIRTSWLYSPWRKNFVKAIIGAATGRSEIRVVSDQVGCPTSAASLAGAIIGMIPALVSDPTQVAGLYHFCDAGIVSRAGFAEEIIRQAGLECRVVPVTSDEYPSVARRPLYSALDTSKITHDFGNAPRPWQETLAECMKNLR